MPGIQKTLENVTNKVFAGGRHKITYGYMDKDYGGAHYGADLVPGAIGISDNVVAIADGVVEYVKESVKGSVSGSGHADALGNNIKIRHADGTVTRYCHLAFGSICVVHGQNVSRGEVIGTMGETGYCFGAHLHFEVWVNGVRVDPEGYIVGDKTIGGAADTPSNSAPSDTVNSVSDVKIGAVVRFLGGEVFASSADIVPAGKNKPACLCKVTNIIHNKVNPVHLVSGDGVVYGWVKLDRVAFDGATDLAPVLKSLDEVAREVVAGLWGNGEERKKKLTAAGYDYEAVQGRVNALLK